MLIYTFPGYLLPYRDQKSIFCPRVLEYDISNRIFLNTMVLKKIRSFSHTLQFKYNVDLQSFRVLCISIWEKKERKFMHEAEHKMDGPDIDVYPQFKIPHTLYPVLCC
jgi:hypothetical protein